MPSDQFSAERRNKQPAPINAASNPLAESPVSLAHGGVVPHIIIRSSRLRLGEFESPAEKRLLQHYLPIADVERALKVSSLPCLSAPLAERTPRRRAP